MMKSASVTEQFRRAAAIYRRTLREQLSESQNHRCCYCGIDIRHGATIDHLVTRSQFGPTSYFNCVAACLSCNQRRGEMKFFKFYKIIKKERRAALRTTLAGAA